MRTEVGSTIMLIYVPLCRRTNLMSTHQVRCPDIEQKYQLLDRGYSPLSEAAKSGLADLRSSGQTRYPLKADAQVGELLCLPYVLHRPGCG